MADTATPTGEGTLGSKLEEMLDIETFEPPEDFRKEALLNDPQVTLPPGFQISVYAGDVPNARQMAAGPDGIVFVGSRSEGKVYAVVPAIFQLRWRALLATALMLGASFALAPGLWVAYLEAAATTSGRLLWEAGGGYNLDFYPLFVVPMAVVILALAMVDR